MHVIGGTYFESVEDRNFQMLFGSGFRAAACLSHFRDVRFHTYFEESEKLQFLANAKAFPFKELDLKPSSISRRFEYQTSVSSPRVNNLESDQDVAEIRINSDEPILRFGMLEKEAIVCGNRVVYDPQNPQHPLAFDANGSTAKELAIVANHREVYSLFGSNYRVGINEQFKSHPETVCVVMKYGPLGALVFTQDGNQVHIPAYRTSDVFSVGTGDVFSAYFAHFWAEEGMSPKLSAEYASKAVSIYVSEFGSIQNLDKKAIDARRFSPVGNGRPLTKPIYLAGPFFTMGDTLLLREIKHAFGSMDVPFFSPIDVVGIGAPGEVYEGDIRGLIDSSGVFANICGLDTGTIYEIGYAQAIKKPVTLFAQDCKKKDLTMLIGGGCKYYEDFTSAVYNSVWDALESE